MAGYIDDPLQIINLIAGRASDLYRKVHISPVYRDFRQGWKTNQNNRKRQL